MKIGIIGAGNVGGTLAKKLGAKGHSIFLGSRKPEDPELSKLAKSIGAHASIGSIKEAIEKSEALILATPWSAVDSITSEYKSLLKGKILIDCTNPLKPDLSGLVVAGDASGGELIQAALPETFVVKAFNSVGFNIMENPQMDGRKAIMYFCGDNANAKHSVQELVRDVGFESLEAGDIKSCRLLEPFALLWISSAYKFGLGREFAFGLLCKKS